MYHNGSYIRSTVSFDEDVIFFMRQHAVVWLRTLSWGLMSLLPLVAILLYNMQAKTLLLFLFGALFMVSVYKYLEVAMIEMALTNKRVIRKKGVVWVQSEELMLSKIESVEITQSILGRILGYGTVSFSGTGTGKVNLKMVANPLGVKREIESYFNAVFSSNGGE